MILNKDKTVADTMRLPVGTWDSHVHVIDEENYPFHNDHPYRPKKASLTQLLEFERQIGASNVCLVAVSVYGNDNSLILDTLTKVGGAARAIVCIDPETISDQELRSMHQKGVRGVRLNLKTWGKAGSKKDLEAQLFTYANRIRHLNWVLQIYLSLEQIALIHDCIPNLGINVVIDHMASPNPKYPGAEQNGYHELLDLLRRNLVWVKLSGIYRFDNLPDLDQYVRALIDANPSRLVWASDWPHTGGTEYNKNGDRFALQNYRKVDDADFIERCFGWCQYKQELVDNIFVYNPQHLWTHADTMHDLVRSSI